VKETVKYLLPFIFSGIFFIIAMKYCNNNKNVNTTNTLRRIDSTITYVKDTNTHTHTSTTIYTNPIFTVNPEIPVDTQKIISMYFTKYLAVDSLQDSLVKIKIIDTLFNNKITYRQYNYNFIKPYQVIKTYTVTNNFTDSKGFYFGLFTGFNRQINSFGAQAFYFKNNKAFGTGWDFLNKSVQLNYLQRIGSR